MCRGKHASNKDKIQPIMNEGHFHVKLPFWKNFKNYFKINLLGAQHPLLLDSLICFLWGLKTVFVI